MINLKSWKSTYDTVSAIDWRFGAKYLFLASSFVIFKASQNLQKFMICFLLVKVI